MNTTWDDREAAIDAAVASFPERFGLRAFPGEEFFVDRRASFWSGLTNSPSLYVYVLREDGPAAFSKGTASELRGQIVELKEI